MPCVHACPWPGNPYHNMWPCNSGHIAVRSGTPSPAIIFDKQYIEATTVHRTSVLGSNVMAAYLNVNLLDRLDRVPRAATSSTLALDEPRDINATCLFKWGGPIYAYTHMCEGEYLALGIRYNGETISTLFPWLKGCSTSA